MAAVCRQVGRYRAALAAANAALGHAKLPEDTVVARRIIAEVALDAGDRTRGLESVTPLRAALRSGVGPFERARAVLTLGLIEERWGVRRRGLARVSEALALAHAHGYHELAYHMQAVHDRLAAPAPRATPVFGPIAAEGQGQSALTPTSHRIVARLLEFDVPGGVLVDAG
jgi:hypothetical protein